MGLRALVFADLQATDGHERCFNAANDSLQLARVRRFFAEIWRIFQEQKCDCLWDLGDTTDDRSDIPLPAIDAVLAGLSPFPKHDMNTKLVGNHDQFIRDGSIHNGRMFEHKFSVVNTTDVFEFDDTLIACASYPASEPALADWLKHIAFQYRNYEKKILLGHWQVAGCTLDGGKAATGIDPMLLRPFSVCLLGHVHKPQSNHNFHYVGSPFQQNFGERDQAKAVGIIDLETLQITWIPMIGFPEYRVMDFPQWVETVKREEEHRYQVYLLNSDQAKAYYAHPLMSYAEPIYNYQLSGEAQKQSSQRRSLTKADVMQRWVENSPPSSRGIQMPLEDVMDLGNAISEAT